jgi:hypothetical protein
MSLKNKDIITQKEKKYIDNKEKDDVEDDDNEEENNDEEDDIENDNDEDDDDDNEEEEENDNDEEENDNDKEEKNSVKKEKEDTIKPKGNECTEKKKYKTKLCFNEYCLQIEENKINIQNINDKIQNYFLKIKEYEKQKYEIEKNNYLIIQKLENIYTKNIEKKKSNYKGNINGGFNKITLVPQVLINFLDLEDGTELPRPKVCSLLSIKFKELGLKTGQYINLDLNTIKVLKLDKSYLNPIKQTQFQTFLATFYK